MLSGDPRVLLKAIAIESAKASYGEYVTYVRPGYHWSTGHAWVASKLQGFMAEIKRAKAEGGQGPRLMLFLPPRWGKSELTSRLLPGWALGREPDWNVGIVSYGAELAEELSADARRVVLDDQYAEVFGGRYAAEPGSSVEIDRQSKAVNHWRVAGHRGGVRAVGVGGALTGRGFDLLIIDDPVKGREEADSELERDKLWKFFRGTLRTRLEPGAGILVIQTRWHFDDLAGRLIEAASANPKTDQWEVISLPALAEDDDPLGRTPGQPLDPHRFDVGDLEVIKASDEREFWAQYQQRPTPDEGDVFHRDWFSWEHPVPPVSRRAPLFQYWDTAHGKRNPKRKGDRSVCGTWRFEGNRYRLVHLWVGRPDYPTLKRTAIELAAAYRPQAIIIEDHASGQSLIQDLRQTALPVLPWKTRNESKTERAKAVAPLWQSGRVAISVPKEAAEVFIREHLQFPFGKYDDIVDMSSMALSHMHIWNQGGRRSRPHYTDFRFAAA